MLEIIKQLQALQELDVIVHGVKQEIEELPNQISEFEDQLKKKNPEIEGYRDRVKILESEKANHEQMLFLEQEKIKKARTRLSGTNIRNTSAYYANQREIEKVKKDVDTIEASLLESMNSLEEANSAIEQLDTEIKDLETSFNETSSEVKARIASLQSEFADDLNRREELTNGINRETLSLYERIHAHFPGNTICRAIDEMCTGCHMHIPPQLFNEVMKSEKVISCPACQRILFYQEEDEASAEAAGS